MNRPIAVFAVALAVFLTPCFWQASPSSARGQEKSDKAELTKNELRDLQGTWKVIVFEQNGKELALQKRKYIFENNKMMYVNGEVKVEWTFSVDPTKNPKQMDLERTSGPGDVTIYVLAGKYMIICGSRDGKTRPSEFACDSDKGGGYLLVLQRQK